MSIQIFAKTRDLRSGTNVVYAQMNITDYLKLVGEDFSDFEIQRRRESFKSYQRMKEDIKKGALLPPITLAIRPELVGNYLGKIDDFEQLADQLEQQNQVRILDGLQRTYILAELRSDGFEFSELQKLLVEFWFEADINKLIYRIIVLNAGQKPMSMRHQVELLFMTIGTTLERDIPNLEIFREREGRRRNDARKFPLDRLVSAYQSYLTKKPDIDRQNLITERLSTEEILSLNEQQLAEQFEIFKKYFGIYADLDVEVVRIYGSEGLNWFGSDNVMNSFFAALGQYIKRIERVDKAVNRLLNYLEISDAGEDPLGINVFNQLREGINARKVNIGVATRKILNNGFKEFFRDEGETVLAECWKSAADEFEDGISST